MTDLVARIKVWESKLLPCPFCGDKTPQLFLPDPTKEWCDDVLVKCGSCDAVGPSILFDPASQTANDIPDLVDEVTGLWNRRAPIESQEHAS